MSYRVVWRPIAEESLAEIWLTARDRQTIEAAADQINDDLSEHPLDVGESRFSNVRVAFLGTLGILFEILESEQEVQVLDIWQCRDRS